MAFTEMNYMSGGGSGGGKSFDFVASTTDTPTDVGFAPTKVIAWAAISSSNLRVFELDVVNNKIWLWANGNTTPIDRTSMFSSVFYTSGNTVHYAALDSGWEVQTYFVAIKE